MASSQPEPAAPHTEAAAEDNIDTLKFVAEWSLFRVAKQLRLMGYDCVCSEDTSIPMIMHMACHEGRIVLTGSRKLGPMLDKLKREVNERIAEQTEEEEAAAAAAAASSEASLAKRRVIVGYNSDGESEYETDDDAPPPDPVVAHLKLNPVKYVRLRPGDPHEHNFEIVVRECGIMYSAKRIFTRCVQGNMKILPVDKTTVAERVHAAVFRVYDNFYQCPCCKKVYWGMDNGILVNFKALRTVEHLQRLCAEKGAAGAIPAAPATSNTRSTGIKRHFFSYPRIVKCTIISFLDEEGKGMFSLAYPMFNELVETVREGRSYRFKRACPRRKDFFLKRADEYMKEVIAQRDEALAAEEAAIAEEEQEQPPFCGTQREVASTPNTRTLALQPTSSLPQ